jgi:glycosyltransferase involved in cell wall biosynthesis
MSDSNRDFVYAAYQRLLDRVPDSAGLSSHVKLLSTGTSRLGLVLGIMAADEFLRRPLGWMQKISILYALVGDELIRSRNYGNIVELICTGGDFRAKSRNLRDVKIEKTLAQGKLVLKFVSYAADTGVYVEAAFAGAPVTDVNLLTSHVDFRIGHERLAVSYVGGAFLVKTTRTWTSISIVSRDGGRVVRTLSKHSLEEERVPGAIPVAISGRFDPTTGIGLHSLAFAHHYEGHFNLSLIDARPDDSNWRALDERMRNEAVTLGESDGAAVSIFTDVLANGYGDINCLKLPHSLIKIAYVVFDSSRLPSWWVDRINENFDAVATPSKWGKQMIEKSGVLVPVFHLPLSTDLKRFASSNPAPVTQSKFRFGTIASYSKRKNILQLVRSFAECFDNNSDVELVVHTPLDFGGGYKEVDDYIKAHGIQNVVLSQMELDDSKYVSLLKSIDVYVLISKGECYSITPRQALALGKPVILSAGHAHDELLDSKLCISVPVRGYEPARYEAFDNQDIGLQCTYDDRDVRAALNDAYYNYIKYAQNREERQAYAMTFDHSSLGEYYRTLANPKNVFLGDCDVIERDRLVTSSKSLYRKYRELIEMDRTRASGEYGRQKIVVPAHDGGFYSVFNAFLSHFVWNWGRRDISAIIPDWRVTTISEYRGITSPMSFCYGRPEDGNIFTKLFYPIADVQVAESDYSNHEFLRDDVIFYDDFNEKNEPNLTYIHASKLYRSETFSQWRGWYHSFYKKHFRLRDGLQSEIDAFYQANMDDDFVIGVHVKHPSHAIEQINGVMPGASDFARKIIEYVSAHQISSYKIFLATDQDAVVHYMRAIFGEKVICRGDIARTTARDDANFASLNEREKSREGHQIQNLIAADPSKWSLKMATDVIVDVHLLAKCDVFIHVTSNIATAVSYINPEVKMLYCE